ncbi:MAG: hypothetical protein R3E89_06010 [Thiolinea sp.]
MGDWSAQSAVRCNDGTPAAGWFSDPTQVQGVLMRINLVRARPVDPANVL